MTWSKSLGLALIAVCCTACSPALDWREFVADGTDLTVSFPCRPDHHSRSLSLAGAKVQMDMLVCSAAAATFAVSTVVVSDPARMASTLKELRLAAVANVRGGEPELSPIDIKGMTPNDQATRLTVKGRLPDGADVVEQSLLFTRGLHAYQAAVIGARPDQRAVDVFFAALRFPS
jgi:hypothetical protein